MIDPAAALIIVDVQQGFDDPKWGPRNNPDSEANVARLVRRWQRDRAPIVVVRHDSIEPASPLVAGTPGNALKPEVADVDPDVLIVKHVNSSFHGTPDLEAWLHEHDIASIVVCGISTNHCVETTCRVGGNLGFDVHLALDATHTYDRTGPDGETIPADQLVRVTAANLHGEFAKVTDTATLLAS